MSHDDSSNSPPVFLTEYDAAWPQRFRDESAVVLRALGDYAAGPIEHVGSTAIPGLVAKPIIDMMVGVRSLPEADAVIPLLVAVGYVYYPYRADVMRWFCKPSPALRLYHLYAVPVDSELWRDRLAFRDYLRSHAGAAAEYASLKQELAELHRFDREAYTEAKTQFVKHILGLASKGMPG